jgi:hypothetical protein
MRGNPVALDKKQFAWWCYFWFLVALAAITPFVWPPDLSGWAQWGFELVGIVGLWGYLRRRPVVHLQLWRIYFFGVIASLIYSSIASFSEKPPDPFSGMSWYGLVVAVMVLVIIITIPLLVGLWRYAFRSSGIWGSTSAA